MFSGVIAIARNDHPLFTKAYGMADSSSGVANTPDTRFQLGEIDKSFTAIAIAQLVEAGKLSYDDPLNKFVEYPGRVSAGKISIKHLLSQTSGLGDYLSAKFTANVRRLKDIQSYLSILEYRPLAFEPGTGFQDSRIGYLLLGRVIEMVSGENYYEYIQHHIFQPAGMKDSFQDFLEPPNPKSAIRYENYFEKDHFVTKVYGTVSPLPARGAPDSATFSTAEDMIRFVAALRNGKLVSPRVYQLMTTPKPELGAKTYGYGFMVNKSPDEGRDVIGHDGDAPGLCAEYDLIRDLKEPCTVVVVSNSSAMGHAVAKRLFHSTKACRLNPERRRRFRGSAPLGSCLLTADLFIRGHPTAFPTSSGKSRPIPYRHATGRNFFLPVPAAPATTPFMNSIFFLPQQNRVETGREFLGRLRFGNSEEGMMKERNVKTGASGALKEKD